MAAAKTSKSSKRHSRDALETLETGGDGNTNSSPPSLKNKQSIQLLHHFFTWNNPPIDALETLETCLRPLCKKGFFQEETGANGTPHIQGQVSCKRKMRWEQFGLPRGIHWEKTRNILAAEDYCQKDDTRTGRRISWTDELQKYIEEIAELYPWETMLLDVLKAEPDNRTIVYVHEPNGGVGKTIFQKYVYTHLEDVIVLSGKAADMKNGIITFIETNKKTPKIVLIDIPRDTGDAVSWAGIEQIKNMFFFSGKYEGGMVCGASPHVMIFSNSPPPLSCLSGDRWRIIAL